MGDRGTVSTLYPIFYLLSSAAEAALADEVREVGNGVNRPATGIVMKAYSTESSLRKDEDFKTIDFFR